MSHVVYTPAEGESLTVTVFGRTFKAGQPVQVPSDMFDRLSANPTFRVADEKKLAQSKTEPVKVDGRSKAARAARDEEAKARAAEYAAEVADAKTAEKDD